MFNKKTLFLLGAGSNSCYGYPLGYQLIELILSCIEYDFCWVPPHLPTNNISLKSYIEFLERIDFSQVRTDIDVQPNGERVTLYRYNGVYFNKVKLSAITEMQELKRKLILRNPTSIDSFLKENPAFADAGKILINYCLMKKDFHAKFTMDLQYENPLKRILQINRENHWYNLILGDILNAPSIAENDVDFLTFNYTCDLERYIYHGLADCEIVQDNDAAKEFNESLLTKRFHHVYGSIYNHDNIRKYTFQEIAKYTSDDFSCLYRAVNLEII